MKQRLITDALKALHKAYPEATYDRKVFTVTPGAFIIDGLSQDEWVFNVEAFHSFSLYEHEAIQEALQVLNRGLHYECLKDPHTSTS